MTGNDSASGLSPQEWAAANHARDDGLIDALVNWAVQDYSEAQVKNAARLIVTRRIHIAPTLAGAVVAESSDGVIRYLCDETGRCICPDFRCIGRCFHGLAAKTLDAGAKAAA